MLTAERLTVRYGSRFALSDCSLTVGEGEWWMLVGPNGAGKTTLIRAVAGAVPFTGELRFGDRPLRAMKPRDRARLIGILDQHNTAAYAYSVEEIVRLGRYAHRTALGDDPREEAAVEQALADAGLRDLRHESVLTLSGGERQRVFLAQVLAQEPRLMILDEPVNHLDLPYQQAIFELITDWLRTPGRAVLSVMHDLSLARRWGTHALVLRDGETLARGRAEEALRDAVLRDAYGMDVRGWMKGQLKVWEKKE